PGLRLHPPAGGAARTRCRGSPSADGATTLHRLPGPVPSTVTSARRRPAACVVLPSGAHGSAAARGRPSPGRPPTSVRPPPLAPAAWHSDRLVATPSLSDRPLPERRAPTD